MLVRLAYVALLAVVVGCGQGPDVAPDAAPSPVDATAPAPDARAPADAGAVCAAVGLDAGWDAGCDEDHDYHRAEACGGEDCDDHEPAVHEHAPDPLGWDLETVRRSADGPLDMAVGPDGVLHAVFLEGWPRRVRLASGTSGQWRFRTVDCRESAQPRVAIAADGTVHVVHLLVDAEADRREVRHAWSSGDAFELERVEDEDDLVTRPAIAIGRDQRVYAAWTAGREGSDPVLVRAWRDDSGWTTEELDGAPPALGGLIALSSAGEPHLVYGDQTPEGLIDIRYAQRQNGLWEVDVLGEVMRIEDGNPSMVLSADDAAHVVFAGTYATNRGGVWAFEHDVFPAEYWASAVGLAVGPDGTVLVAGERAGWDFSHCLSVARRGTDGWSLSEIDPNCGFREAPVGLGFDDLARGHLLYFANGLRHALQSEPGQGRDQDCDGFDF